MDRSEESEKFEVRNSKKNYWWNSPCFINQPYFFSTLSEIPYDSKGHNGF